MSPAAIGASMAPLLEASRRNGSCSRRLQLLPRKKPKPGTDRKLRLKPRGSLILYPAYWASCSKLRQSIALLKVQFHNRGEMIRWILVSENLLIDSVFFHLHLRRHEYGIQHASRLSKRVIGFRSPCVFCQ